VTARFSAPVQAGPGGPHSFLDRFSKNEQISNLMKIRPVGDELFHAEALTDIKKLLVAFAILRTRLKIDFEILIEKDTSRLLGVHGKEVLK
jgi:hypothetical protein